VYRNTTGGNITEPFLSPTQQGKDLFASKKIHKIVSGYNHTLVLADDKVYAWGDPDTYVLGRMPTARRKFEQSLQIEALGPKSVVDVFSAGYHSFIKQQKASKKKDALDTRYFTWGLNNYGQLGLGAQENQFTPTEIDELAGKNIVQIVGGEHFTILLEADGTCYSFGRNDEGQLGLGENLTKELWRGHCDAEKEQKEKIKNRKSKKTKEKVEEKVEVKTTEGE
jgi:regulator of chromosome condensation